MLINKKWRKTRVSSVGGKATIGQESPRYAETPGNKGRQGISNRSYHGSAAALVGSQLASAKQNRFLCQCKQRCHTTVLASSAFVYVWWVAGARWLWVHASSRRGLCRCVSLIPCLPFRGVCLLEHSAALTLLPIKHLQADSRPETSEHRTKCCLHCCGYAGLFGFPPDQCSPFLPGFSEGWFGGKPGGQVHSSCYLERYSAALPLCSKWQSKRAAKDVAPENSNKWRYLY